ncbi:MAG: histidinol-phosphatase [Spirochaetia bacterium]|nr:histidinol-phosphatase [Spirochaetia bacterium]
MDIIKHSEKFILDTLPALREIILKYYQTPYDIEIKTDNSPVTIADREAENYIKEQIMKTFPDHGIIGEESGTYKIDAEYRWIVDPIDGTKSFISNTPLFGTLIALTLNNKPVLGCIYLPVSNDVLIGDNQQTRLNGNTVLMPEKISLDKSIVLTTDYKDFSKFKPRSGFDRLMSACRLSRTWGDCFGYYLVTTGKAHVMIDPAMSVWDKMALIPIINGAGGVITDFYGNPPEAGDSIVACVKGIHKEVIEILNS